jgi:HK97 gp10 family phage protein
VQIEAKFEEKGDTALKVHQELIKALYGVGLDFVREAIPKTPVDTGNLVNSFGVSVDKGEYSVTVTNSANYAAFVEYGHLINGGPGKVKEKPFMRNTLYQGIDKWQKKLADIIKEGL